jgi:hypothetical protein
MNNRLRSGIFRREALDVIAGAAAVLVITALAVMVMAGFTGPLQPTSG